MKNDELLQRIEIDPNIAFGKPVVRGTRIPVWLILDLLEIGQQPQEIVGDYPGLTVEDVEAARLYGEVDQSHRQVRAL
jgi:uncharacterized protein (DUF433 family)